MVPVEPERTTSLAAVAALCATDEPCADCCWDSCLGDCWLPVLCLLLLLLFTNRHWQRTKNDSYTRVQFLRICFGHRARCTQRHLPDILNPVLHLFGLGDGPSAWVEPPAQNSCPMTDKVQNRWHGVHDNRWMSATIFRIYNPIRNMTYTTLFMWEITWRK